jgi:hypothetical protein
MKEVGLSVLPIETKQDERHDRRTDGLGDERQRCREVKMRHLLVFSSWSESAILS